LLVDGVALSTVKKYVDDLRTSVGGSSIGLIYEVSQLKDTVGDSSSGLVYKVN
jgi:hypothetical protein